MELPKPPKKPNNLKNAAMLSGIAFQMGAIIAVFVFAGLYLDEYFELNKLILTPVLSIIGVIISIVNLIRKVRSLTNG